MNALPELNLVVAQASCVHTVRVRKLWDNKALRFLGCLRCLGFLGFFLKYIYLFMYLLFMYYYFQMTKIK